jgi:polyisoprenoid-binding protein YceI
MKRSKVPILSVAVLWSCFAFLPANARAGSAAGPQTLTATAVQIEIEGQSTLHGWRVSAGAATVTAEVSGGISGLLYEISEGGLKGLDLVLGVDSLTSTEGSGMDKNMHRTLESDKFPAISFSLKSYRLAGMTVTAQGDLDIHGQTKAVTLTGLLESEGRGLSLKGSYPLLMSDYGVKPPVMMFGTIHVADQVKILYSFKLSE